MAESYADPDVLVSTDWVAEHLDDPSVAVVEVNTDLDEDYNTGHVPGAVGWSLHVDLEDRTKRDIPGVGQIEALMSRSGIEVGTTVRPLWRRQQPVGDVGVLGPEDIPTPRCQDNERWQGEVLKEDCPLSTEPPSRRSTDYRPSAPDRSLRAMKDYVAGTWAGPGFRPLDTRSYEEFAGELTSAPGTPQPDIYRKGRIPGAVHVPWDDGAAEDGSFLPAAELRRMYEAQGLSPDDEVAPYCRLGVRASYSWFVLKYLLGYSRVRNYDGLVDGVGQRLRRACRDRPPVARP